MSGLPRLRLAAIARYGGDIPCSSLYNQVDLTWGYFMDLILLQRK